MIKLTIFLLFSAFIVNLEGAKILGVVPTPSFSHQIFFRPIWKELAKRGHEVIVITTDPINDPSFNITEIDVGNTYDLWNKKYDLPKVIKEYGNNLYGIFKTVRKGYNEIVSIELENPEVQRILNGEQGKFDLLIVEYLHPVMFAFAYKLNCPFIGATSLDLPFVYHNAYGNPTHPILYPDIVLPFEGDLTFAERLASTFYTGFILLDQFLNGNHEEDKVVKKYFGENTPSLSEIGKNASLLFLNVNPVLNLRPLGPASIAIGGGTHLESTKPLPEDLKKYLDDGKDGVIYFSLGTNVKSSSIDSNLRKIFLDTFKELPYRILWKFDVDIPNLPTNVKIVKWLPQQDVLKHQHVKAFITQGGLQSTEEALFSQVPIVGIPFIMDQESNIKKVTRRGLGIFISKETLTKDKLREAVLEVINNPSYKQKMKEIADLTYDQPMSGLEKAVWWAEFVLRNKGAKHLRNPILDMPAYKYYMLDVFGAFASIFFFIFVTIYFIVKVIITIVCKCKSCKKTNVKHKIKKN